MILTLYLLKKFFPVFLGALIFFAFTLNLIDLLINLWQYILEAVPLKEVLHIAWLYVPKTLSFSIPLAVLFSAAYTISSLHAANELVVIFCAGVSLFRFTLSLLTVSFLLSIAFFFFENSLVVSSYAQKKEAQRLALNEPLSYDNDKVVVLADSGLAVYRADYYDDTQKKLYGLYIFLRNTDKTLNKIIFCRQAAWDGETWIFENPITYQSKNDRLEYSNDTDFVSHEEPDIFKNIALSVEEVDTKQAFEYIQKLKKTGLPFAEELSLYYKKFSFPFIIFISVFLSIGLSGKSRKNILVMSLVSCVGAAVLFYVLQMVTMLFAKFGYISAFAGAWFPVFFFIVISVILLQLART